MDFLPLCDVGVVLSNSLQSQLLHQVDLVGFLEMLGLQKGENTTVLSINGMCLVILFCCFQHSKRLLQDPKLAHSAIVALQTIPNTNTDLETVWEQLGLQCEPSGAKWPRAIGPAE